MRFATLCTVLICYVYFSVINTDYVNGQHEPFFFFWLTNTAVFSKR